MRYTRNEAKGCPTLHREGKCDRCGGPLERPRYGNFSVYEPAGIRFSFQGGYESVFGDGNWVEGALCRDCVEQVYGPYLRIYKEETALPGTAAERPPAVSSECMRLKDRGEREPSAILQCDRCGREIDSKYDEGEWQEAFTLRYYAGADNTMLETGSVMEADLCQHCVKHTMGAWLRITQDTVAWPKHHRHGRPRWVYQQGQLAGEWARRFEDDES